MPCPSVFADSVEGNRDAKEGSVALDSLLLSERVYLGADAHGSLLFRPNLTVTYGLGYAKAIFPRELIALGLTEICCKLGKGKVYYFPLPENREIAALAAMPPRLERDLAVYSYHRLPQLVYIPFVWEDEDKSIWCEMDHPTRLLVLNARSGGVAHEDVVMPMGLVYDAVERKNVRINGYTADGAGCKALLTIIPGANVGWVRQFQQDDQHFGFIRKTFEDGGGAFWVRDVAALKEADCRVDDAEAVITRLWDMYFEGEERSLLRFEDVMSGLMKLHENWVTVEQGVKVMDPVGSPSATATERSDQD